jgi:hypothetical protein
MYIVITDKSSVSDVSAFLKQHDLSKWISLFKEEEINGEALLMMTDEDLVDVGVAKAFDRKRIMKKINDLRQGRNLWVLSYYRCA